MNASNLEKIFNVWNELLKYAKHFTKIPEAVSEGNEPDGGM